MNKEKIAEQAKKIMDDFSKALESVDSKEDFGISRLHQLRDSKEESFQGFRERMFKNAKKKNDDFIIAEKKGW
jgi:Asp-tRNA(Asn)/Glu-tRNA(Gln) amidotransferase C subunit